MRSRVPRAANVYLLRTRSRVTFAASLQQVCTGRELGLSVARCTNRLVLRVAATALCAYSVAEEDFGLLADCNGRRSSDIPKPEEVRHDDVTPATRVSECNQ